MLGTQQLQKKRQKVIIINLSSTYNVMDIASYYVDHFSRHCVSVVDQDNFII